MAGGIQGPVPYKQIGPSSQTELPPQDVSERQRRFRKDAWFWIGAGGSALLALALWPWIPGILFAASLAGVFLVLGVVYLRRARSGHGARE